MSRSGIENSSSNFRNNIIMSEGKLNPSEKLNPTENSTTVNNNPSARRPKDESFVNLDDVNMMTRTSVEKRIVESDNPDSKHRPKKPINYAAKKTIAQGMMDIALLTSNANQLKSLFDYQRQASTFYFVLFMIVLSLILQVSVGVSLIFKGRYDSKGKDKAAAARVNKWVMAAVFLITVINIFIAVFSTSPPVMPPPGPGGPPAITTQSPVPRNA